MVDSEAATDGTPLYVEKRFDARFELSCATSARVSSCSEVGCRHCAKRHGGCNIMTRRVGEENNLRLTLGAMMGLEESRERTMMREGKDGNDEEEVLRRRGCSPFVG